MFPSELTARRSAPLWNHKRIRAVVPVMLGSDKHVSGNPVNPDSLCNQDYDQSCMPTGGGGVQRRPQLVVLRVDISSSVQQDLHHLLIIVDATLGRGGKKEETEIHF